MFNLNKQHDHTPAGEEDRVPPGQYVTDKFPVMHYGHVPIYRDVQHDWDLRVWGELEAPVSFSFAKFRALPTCEVVTDIHCVTRWSKLDTRWEGVRFSTFVQALPPLKPTARFVLAHCEQNYTTNVPLEVLMQPNALLAYRYEGEELTPEHGFPLRLLTPGTYFWKSAKWLRGIEFLSEDTSGFWERYGYHNNADPWKEERYAE
ncbi:sulfite oxidase-like oxidoreductase [Candidatus Viridilinea mediisalina]|uniref:Sulfite oxidase-like oxidoreductase n=1 Tax=Candidatus Viridilinea mediisalina TaxID=2024553 RepID=A0A2A6RK03_9CHLR|nr:sulfite oxidase-like oxidoreductase [Candidatus Viridilinea mediisalina]PDW03397.1 sulfite oxidase-like oxidoreductase [Candidatus Viridilinea mediisalina]